VNKIEALKAEKDGLEIQDDLVRFAREGWKTIGDDDKERLKWVGVFMRRPTPGRSLFITLSCWLLVAGGQQPGTSDERRATSLSTGRVSGILHRCRTVKVVQCRPPESFPSFRAKLRRSSSSLGANSLTVAVILN